MSAYSRVAPVEACKVARARQNGADLGRQRILARLADGEIRGVVGLAGKLGQRAKADSSWHVFDVPPGDIHVWDRRWHAAPVTLWAPAPPRDRMPVRSGAPHWSST